MLKYLMEQRAALKAALEAITKKAEDESRGLSDVEDAEFGTKLEEMRALDARIVEVRDAEAAERAAAEARVDQGTDDTREQHAHVVDAPIYARGNASTSYFRDLFNATKRGDAQAMDRLVRSNKQNADELVELKRGGQRATEIRSRLGGEQGVRDVEQRALASDVANKGAEFAPPLWLLSDFARLARAGRKFVDSIGPRNLPSGVSSIDFPKVTSGTSTAVQATQNSALSQTDLATDSVSSGISTIGGKQVVSMQMLEQSGIPFDEIVLQDIAADYARSYDKQGLDGSGASGQLQGVHAFFAGSGGNSNTKITWTQASPTVALFYSQLAKLISAVEATRFVAPDVIWMHPRRWAWIMGASDTAGRPLVLPQGSAYNALGSGNALTVEGATGELLGLPVVTDPNMLTNIGTGTNQDDVMVGVRGDLRLYEGATHAETFTETYADSMGVLFRLYAYSAQVVNRYDCSVGVLSGTGLVTPAFAG